MKPTLPLPADYGHWLASLKSRIQGARQRALLSANAEQIRLYHDIGRDILERQSREGWGAKVIDQLSTDLRAAFPDMKGLSSRNLKYMKFFAEHCPARQFGQQTAAPIASPQIGQQTAAQLLASPGHGQRSADQLVSPPAISPTLPDQLPWFHIVTLLTKLADPALRDWYARQAIQHAWPRDTLTVQIKNQLHLRQGLAVTNFDQRLSPPQAGLATEILKDPYHFDFLGLTGAYSEADLESAILREIEGVLLELGTGFTFVARQKRMSVGRDDFHLDLLFFHRHLRRLIAVELKLEHFQPAHVGQMEFYLRWLDKHERAPGEEAPLGLILCASADAEQVELLQLDAKSIRVSEYLTELPPIKLLQARLHQAIAHARELTARHATRAKETQDTAR